jgi:integrase/recombinase XerD
MRYNIDPKHRCMKPEDWPAADRDAWAAARCKGTILRPGRPASKWAGTTTQSMIESYGRFVTWAKFEGLLNPAAAPAQLVSSDNVLRYVEHLSIINASLTVVNRVRGLFFIANALAPHGDWEWLRTIWYNLQRAAKPARNKRARVVEAPELLALGLELMAAAERGSDRTLYQRALDYRDGLIIALMAARPLRLRNFAAVEPGVHLVRTAEGYSLEFQAHEIKTRRELDWTFPAGLVPNLERYRTFYRPLLFPINRGSPRRSRRPEDCRALWVSAHGTPMSSTTVYGRVILHTKRKFGRSVNPHLFRDDATTVIAIEDPERVGISMPLLGHSNPITAQRVYDQSGMVSAQRSYQDYVHSLRSDRRDRTVGRKNRKSSSN